jgi:glycerophosphoryl diester phosphodiesterase
LKTPAFPIIWLSGTRLKTFSSALELLASKRPLIIGHRGYCALAPENTLPSFQLALEAGADLVELDYHHSKDGIPIVIHDRFLDRTTNARKKWRRLRIKVGEKTAEEIQNLDAGSWFDKKFCGAKVPLLTEALDLICGNGRVALVEHKSGDAETLAKLLKNKKLINRVVVISFDWSFLHALHEFVPEQVLGALGPPTRTLKRKRRFAAAKSLSRRLLDELLPTGARLAVWNRRVTAVAIGEARRLGLGVWTYTVNRPLHAILLRNLGVKGIITNRISLIQKALMLKSASLVAVNQTQDVEV